MAAKIAFFFEIKCLPVKMVKLFFEVLSKIHRYTVQGKIFVSGAVVGGNKPLYFTV